MTNKKKPVKYKGKVYPSLPAQPQQGYAPQAQGPVGQAYAQMQAQGQVVNPDNKDLNDPLPF